MDTESDRRTFDAEAMGRRPHSEPRIERLAYSAPGAVSVAAQTKTKEADSSVDKAHSDIPQEAAGLAARIVALEEGLRATETEAARNIERLSHEGREAAQRARREAEQEAKAAIDRSVQQIGAALESFRREREDYFATVEREVVLLALAIAARVLNREAQFDPMLLGGAVRVALGHLDKTTVVRLRCPVDEVDRWKDNLCRSPELRTMPEVVGDLTFRFGECVLETELGTVDLGVKAQLVEIESGFFDLLARRPGASLQVLGSVS